MFIQFWQYILLQSQTNKYNICTYINMYRDHYRNTTELQ